MRFTTFLLFIVLIIYSSFLSAAPSLNSSTISGAFYNGTDYIFSPNEDGIYDNITIDLKYSEQVSAEIYIEDSNGLKIKSIYSSPSVTNPQAKTWNGTDISTNLVSDGVYIIKTNITSTSDGSNSLIEVTKCFIDNTAPSFSNYNSSAANSSQNTTLNVTIIESNLQKVLIEFNGTNYTATSNNSGFFSFTILNGNYSANQTLNYFWYANDSVGNFNKSSEQSFTILDDENQTTNNTNEENSSNGNSTEPSTSSSSKDKEVTRYVSDFQGSLKENAGDFPPIKIEGKTKSNLIKNPAFAMIMTSSILFTTTLILLRRLVKKAQKSL